MIQTSRYRQVFANLPFRFFWIGFTGSVLGDTMSRVALTWYVYDLTNSARALGLLSLTYTGPVVIGGFMAGWLLDRFDRRKILMMDNLVRGGAFILIPLLHAANALELWHIYAVSAVYGTLMMISLAGSPAFVPDLVDESQLSTANALETLSYTLSNTVGPLMAGFLIPFMGAVNVILLDAGSYLFFALLLWWMPSPSVAKDETDDQEETSYRLRDSFQLLLRNPILSSTTVMFMLANLGLGALLVWLPILSDQVLDGGSQLYGILLGTMAAGEVISSMLVGTLVLRIPLGRLICVAQMASGAALSFMILSLSLPIVLIAAFLFGLFSAPLTIWAQTLRMQIIPPKLRGRTFALLRLLMQSTFPLGGAVAGLILPLTTATTFVTVAAGVVGLPGMVGSRVKALWNSSSEG